MTNQPQPDICDYPGCYVPATTRTAAGTKYCDRHKPAVKRVYVPGSSGMFRKHDGTEFDQRKKPR